MHHECVANSIRKFCYSRYLHIALTTVTALHIGNNMDYVS